MTTPTGHSGHSDYQNNSSSSSQSLPATFCSPSSSCREDNDNASSFAQQDRSILPPTPPTPLPTSTSHKNRCFFCRKKQHMLLDCLCHQQFCVSHRTPESHSCPSLSDFSVKDRNVLSQRLPGLVENHGMQDRI